MATRVTISPSVRIYPSLLAARIAAAELQSGEEDGWEYKARSRPDGKALVDIYDEDGHRVGSF